MVFEQMERQTHDRLERKGWGAEDSSVVRAPDSRSKDYGFVSRQERWEDLFLLQCQPSVMIDS